MNKYKLLVFVIWLCFGHFFQCLRGVFTNLPLYAGIMFKKKKKKGGSSFSVLSILLLFLFAVLFYCLNSHPFLGCVRPSMFWVDGVLSNALNSPNILSSQLFFTSFQHVYCLLQLSSLPQAAASYSLAFHWFWSMPYAQLLFYLEGLHSRETKCKLLASVLRVVLRLVRTDRFSSETQGLLCSLQNQRPGSCIGKYRLLTWTFSNLLVVFAVKRVGWIRKEKKKLLPSWGVRWKQK